MPPHCDSIDGPVVTAARNALDKGMVEIALAFVPESGEREVKAAFDLALRTRKLGPDGREVGDLHFFETVVRVHRQGEGAPYTGLKPAGLDVGPVIPVAEYAIKAGAPDRLVDVLTAAVRGEVERRFEHTMELKSSASKDVKHARNYVEAMLGLEVWSNNLYKAVAAPAHMGHGHEE
jgi:uncharacterized protein DUF6448